MNDQLTKKTEIWKQVPGFGEHYEASSFGNVRVKDRVITRKHSTGCVTKFSYKGRLLSQYVDNGYLFVTFGVDGKTIKRPVHYMVLSAFCGERPEGLEACHCNGIRTDNRIENLRWDSHTENNRDRIKHGTIPRGEKHHYAVYSDEFVESVRNSGLHYEAASESFGLSRTHAHRIMKGVR